MLVEGEGGAVQGCRLNEVYREREPPGPDRKASKLTFPCCESGEQLSGINSWVNSRTDGPLQ